MKKIKTLLLSFLLTGCLLFASCSAELEEESAAPENPVSITEIVSETDSTEEEIESEAESEPEETETENEAVPASSSSFDLSEIPAFSGDPYVVVNDNTPFFTEEEITDESYESYSALDELGRCGAAMACIGTDLMPIEDRGDISSVKPTGWHSVEYENVDGKHLYNRCHLIGYQLTAENANERNLITGTRYLNVEGMLPFENMVADYITETENHVLYRVTPVFDGEDLVARGVLMEAMSVEDDGDGILFNVYCYNNQPGIAIDYATGDSEADNSNSNVESEAEEKNASVQESSTTQSATYILNTNTKKFHLPGCSSVQKISDGNKQEYTGSRDELIQEGYSPCGSCNP